MSDAARPPWSPDHEYLVERSEWVDGAWTDRAVTCRCGTWDGGVIPGSAPSGADTEALSAWLAHAQEGGATDEVRSGAEPPSGAKRSDGGAGKRSMEVAEKVRKLGYRLGGVTSRDTAGRFTAGADDWERWWNLVEVGPGCWLWLGRTTSDGYPLFDIRRPDGDGWTPVRAARWGWENTRGPLPAGWTLEHDCHTRDLTCPGGPACRHRPCVRLHDHFEAVTNAENLRRRHARRRAQQRQQGETSR